MNRGPFNRSSLNFTGKGEIREVSPKPNHKVVNNIEWGDNGRNPVRLTFNNPNAGRTNHNAG